MAKIFIDTELFDDSWFMSLSKDAKILWMYLITKCDHAGVIDINAKLLEFQTGIKSYVTVSKQLENRIVYLRDNYYFIPKFIDFQYPGFPRSNVKQQQGAIKILESFGLINEGVLTVTKDLPESYGNDNGNGNVSLGANKILEAIEFYKKEKDEYKNELYGSLVDFMLGKNVIGEPLNKILVMENPISRHNFEDLIEKAKDNDKKLTTILIDLENNQRDPKRKKTHKSLSMTVYSWINYNKK